MKADILLTKKQVGFIISELRVDLINYYTTIGEVEVITLLDGATYFASELFSKECPFIVNQHFIKIKSYCGTIRSSPQMEFCGFNPNHIENKHVLLVDDILDSGRTLEFTTELLCKMNPRTLTTCVLLQKIGTRKCLASAKFVGARFFSTRFVYGCGMDCNGQFRELKDIWILKE